LVVTAPPDRFVNDTRFVGLRTSKETEVTIVASALVSSSVLEWTICGCVALITASALSYRITARRFGWGPSDT
jgi:hypothetical protein